MLLTRGLKKKKSVDLNDLHPLKIKILLQMIFSLSVKAYRMS